MANLSGRGTLDSRFAEARAWHEATFPDATHDGVGLKLVEEACELAVAMGAQPWQVRAVAGNAAWKPAGEPISEAADVAIVLAACMRFIDVFTSGPLAAEMKAALKRNAERAAAGRWPDAAPATEALDTPERRP